MAATSNEFLYLSFVLPSLFALSLVAEGIYKISRSQEGIFPFLLGTIFIISIVFAYIYISG